MASMTASSGPTSKKGAKEEENEVDVEQMSSDIRK